MNIDKFFSNFDNPDSYAILFITIIGFLFGLVVGLLLKGAKLRAYKKQLKAETAKAQALEAEKITLEGNLLKKETETKESQEELRKLIEKVDVLEAEKQSTLSELYTSQQTIEKIQASNHAYSLTIEDLNNQVIGLNTQNEQLLEEVSNQTNYGTPQNIIEEDRGAVDDATLNRLAAVEEQLQIMATQNQELKELMSTMKSETLQTPLVHESTETDTKKEPTIEELTHRGKDVLEGKIVDAPSHVDDLTKIEGLGSFTEKKLNEIGIYTYGQIAGWSDDMVEYVSQEIGFIPGRIQKDNWVEQAEKLNKIEKPKGKSKLPKKYQDPTNLKIIEGIGPKIESLFKADGINNWTELSASSKKRLNGILKKAGKRFQMHDPSTWSKQATLAANGKWDALEKYQDELKGGR